MLRYFYILFNCIPLCFCYNYIEENQRFRKRNENSEIENAKHEISKVVQFDVANFLRNTATEKLQDYESIAYRAKNRDTRKQSEFYYEAPLNENIKKRDENTNYLYIDSEPDASDKYTSTMNEDRFDSNQHVFGKITMNEDKLGANRGNKVKKEQNELLIDRDLIQNPENKCAFKDMKVPFFSRKPLTAKKQRRKLFCINCTKTYANNALNSETNSKIKQLSNKIKRSYGNLCPKCIKELLIMPKKEPERINQIHSSREFYQNVVTAQENIQNDKRPITTEDNYFANNDRLKRQENKEKERQLKELAEVEKKVNSFQMTTPKFTIVS